MQPLVVCSDHRHLARADEPDRPFLWLGDTAWTLPALTTNEISLYMNDRASRGFNVIQGPVLIEYNHGRMIPNANGSPSLDNPRDLLSLNAGYARHVDFMIEEASRNGLYLAIVPAWAQLMDEFSPAELRAFGAKVAARFDAPNIVWIAGGEAAGETTPERVTALAEGLKDGCKGSRLVSVHPSGQRSSSSGAYSAGSNHDGHYEFHSAPWLDFNMLQSGHLRDYPNWRLVQTDFAMKPPKPVIESEYFYENHPHWPERTSANPSRATALDSRKGGYWAIFSGAAGYTYGHHAIWPFYTKGKSVHTGQPTMDWREALAAPGATSMEMLGRLMRRLPEKMFPDQTLAAPADGNAEPRRHIAALRDGTPGKSDATVIAIYTPEPQTVAVIADALPAKMHAVCFDPATGRTTPVEISAGSIAPQKTVDGDAVIVIGTRPLPLE